MFIDSLGFLPRAHKSNLRDKQTMVDIEKASEENQALLSDDMHYCKGWLVIGDLHPSNI